MDEPSTPDVPNPGGDAGTESPGSGGVPLWLAGAAVCLVGGLGILLGLKVGRMVGEASLGEPTRVEPIFVERCADCAQRHAAEHNGTQIPAPTAAEVEAMVARQERVERAE